MKYIDVHTHLHDIRIRPELDRIMDRAESRHVKYMASCATTEDDFDRTICLAEQYPSIIPFFGIHPWFLNTRSGKWKENLEAALVSVSSGIGETGLDFADKHANRDEQLSVFQYHIDLARQMKQPINIHIRKAWDAFIHLLKKMGPMPVAGLIHSYSGSADMIPVFEKYNLYISFSGSVTRPGARKVVAAIKNTPDRRRVFETDTPDIYPSIENPDPARLNEPGNLPQIVEIAAQRMSADSVQLAEQAFENSLRLFDPVLAERKSP